ncbi:hypothetical protein HMPREF1619_01351 [Klebsiella pneumoniae 909957]|nr:hypothetical protein HMPREF1619_01351 [Klebsiella pneumoniae 909957]
MRHGLAAGWNARFGAGRTHIQDTPKPAGSPLFVTCLLALVAAPGGLYGKRWQQ